MMKNRDDGFLAAFRRHRQLYVAALDVEQCVSLIALGEDTLTVGVIANGGLSAVTRYEVKPSKRNVTGS